MTDVPDPDQARLNGAAEPGAPAPDGANPSGLLVSRRTALVGGAIGAATVIGIGALDPERALAATDPPEAMTTDFVSVPTTGTAPEQLRLAWGADPTTQVTVSWSTPGTVAMPAPTLAYSRSPLSARNPGTVIALPTSASPLDLTAGPRVGPTATSFADGLSGQTTFHYHAPLTGLEPGSRYYYEVSDGASPASTADGSFFTAPSGRAAYRFTAFGDIGTPYSTNPSGYNWTESSDVSIYTANGVISPGDGNGPGLFHLMLGDLSYANVNPGSTPAVWRDYAANVSPASANQPWMPIMGNHEVELGICDLQGTPATDTSANPYPGPYFNGPYGAGNYLARHLLPDNGLTNTDGNSLQGSFYSFQVGTVLFVCLNTNDVAYQNPQTVSTGTTGKTPFSHTYNSGVTLAGTTPSVSQYLATGRLAPVPATTQLVPDTSSGTPHLQTQWLEQQLQAARAPGSDVDMIVVCEHHCALSSGPSNGCDMAIRAAWLPLYDQYEVDLVIGGHDHDYEASYPVRGYDQDKPGVATAPFTDAFGNSYKTGDPVNTRRPTVVQTEPTTLPSGKSAWNTGGGTVFLQLGGAGAAAGKTPANDQATGLRQAVVWVSDAGVAGTQDAHEDATWSRIYDSSSNYGYAVFDVDPGNGPGETTLTYQWFAIPMPDALGDQPAVTTDVLYETNGVVTAPTLPAAPYEEFVFVRSMSGQVSISGATGGAVAVGGALTAVPSGWPNGASYAYRWLRNNAEIAGADSASYTAVAADAGLALTVTVTVTLQSYPSASATSAAVGVTVPSTPSAPTAGKTALSLTSVTISGAPKVGELLTANVGGAAAAATLGYQWLRNGSAIGKATSSTYRVVAADAGHELAVAVAETEAGFSGAARTSDPVKVPGEPFKKTSRPTIDGMVAVGHAVTVKTGDWSPSAHFRFQWLLDGRPIAHATHGALTLKSGDAGKKLSVRVTGTHEGYAAHEATSREVEVQKSALKAHAPRVTGKLHIGQTLHVHTGQWAAGTEFSYRWYAGGRAVDGATGHSLRLAPEYRGKRIAVEVIGRLAGQEASARSAESRVVRRPWSWH